MCLTIKKVSVNKKPRTVYKVMELKKMSNGKVRLMSYYVGMWYELGKIYKSEFYLIKNIEFHKKLYRIEMGAFHSFVDKAAIRKFFKDEVYDSDHAVIVRCIIPKNSIIFDGYYHGDTIKTDSVASTSIMVDKMIYLHNVSPELWRKYLKQNKRSEEKWTEISENQSFLKRSSGK